MLELLQARAITHVVIVNQSVTGNSVALRTMSTIYEKLYKKHFNLSYEAFKRAYIRTITMSKIHSYNFRSHSGIVIDEAHNLFSDNKTDTKKVVKVSTFIQKISVLDGIKVLLLSATPLFGDVSSLQKFHKILYRNPKSESQDIRSSLISYTQIDYTHLNIVQRINTDYGAMAGDYSFELANGVVFPFKFYVSKPSPMQIADFARLLVDKEAIKAPFQSKQKPRIVSSSPYEVVENGVRSEQIQSAIGAEIVKLINKTVDGTIIIYCDLVEDGARAIGRYLDMYGFESYTKQSDKSFKKKRVIADTHDFQDDPVYVGKKRMLSEKTRELHALTRKNPYNTSGGVIEDLLNQRGEYSSGDNIYHDVLASLTTFTNSYVARHVDNTKIIQDIDKITAEIRSLRDEIDMIEKERGPEVIHHPSRKQRYLLYLSDMSAEQMKGFKDFNSKDNWNGSRIKVIIGSRVMRDGVDIHHAVQTHIIIPEWRIPGYIQAQHRGIRSSGHAHLINERAIKLVEKERSDPSIPHNKKITYAEAREKIIRDKVTVEIYNHFIDMNLLTEDDIRDARQFIDVEEKLVDVSDNDILRFLCDKNNAGVAIIKAAIEAYRDVGAKMMDLHVKAIDYKLNVSREHIHVPDDVLAKKDVELFFMEDNVEVIIHQISNMLFEHSYKNTDRIFDELLNHRTKHNFTEQMIATAIMELTQNRGTLYHKYFGLNLYVKLWETDTESIIYLCTSKSDNRHPYIAVVDTLGYSTNISIKRAFTHVRRSDIETLTKSHTTFSQLKDLLQRIMEGADPTAFEVTFLTQLSNYWAFSWKDLMQPLDMLRDPVKKIFNISVYVFENHIVDPSMNCLARDLGVHEYSLSSREWKYMKTESIKNIFHIRYGRFIWLYREFKFVDEPRFASYYAGGIKTEQSETNGIILVKDYYRPLHPNSDVMTLDEYVDNLFTKSLDTLIDIGSKIVIKMFAKAESRGSQIGNAPRAGKSDRDTARERIAETISEGITLPFFLYDLDNSVNNGEFNILNIKLYEMEQMRLASSGKPPLRFKIYAVEKMIIDPIEKQELYKRIYKMPEGLR
jgi:hypothetical protein